MVKNDVVEEIPLSFAVTLLLAVGLGYAYLNYLRFDPSKVKALAELMNVHLTMGLVSALGLLINLTFIGIFITRTFGLQRQGRKLDILRGKRRSMEFGWMHLVAFLICIIVFGYSRSGLLREFVDSLLKVFPVARFYPVEMYLSFNLAACAFLLSKTLLRFCRRADLAFGFERKLTRPVRHSGEIIIGTSPGELAHGGQTSIEEWVKIPARGINGGVFVTGSIGSGKTQGAVLRYLAQILSEPKGVPAILAVDPKGTFLKDAEILIRSAGLGDRIVKISLNGNVSFNPVYATNPLRDSKFVGLAEMVRSAAVNFMGKSSDSPFWDVSASHLIRNTITYCAAVHGYFTLLDLYRAIVRASKQNLAEDLRTALAERDFTEEERFNIACAVEYFENEYSQLEDRVRTGIVATSTAFINQFQEFAAHRIFCPSEEMISIPSMESLIREGKILLFDVQLPGLARSMGTFIKLHFEQAVLSLTAELKEKDMPFTTALIIDEYQDVVTCGGGGTIGDDTFLAKARESKPAVLVATQSVSSLINTIGNPRAALELIQNFRTRIACHSSDLETIKVFQELAGKDELELETVSFSETAQSAKLNYLAGGFDSKNSSLNESVSKAKRREFLVTGKEFSRLRTFEAFAQVFDGVETKFMKLYLKPHFLLAINTKHEAVLENLRRSVTGGFFKKLGAWMKNWKFVFGAMLLSVPLYGAKIPNVCSVAESPAFLSCLELNIGGCTCGFPPRPCASISYYVPQSFIEVWPEARRSYFMAIPGAGMQLAPYFPFPFGTEGDDDTQSFHARAIAVPLAGMVFRTMPAGGTRGEKMCFDGMSEHFGSHWRTGKGDFLQPAFLAWSLAPKACLLKGAATSAGGDGGSGFSGDSLVCSFVPPKTDLLPPSTHPVCNGWGTFFPRYGTYAGPSSLTGALMIASRIKSLSSEVLKSMPSSTDEKWQMIYPQSSSCFREGQNVGVLETLKDVRETARLVNGKLKGHLFVIWQRTSSCRDFPAILQAKAAALAIPAACRGLK